MSLNQLKKSRDLEQGFTLVELVTSVAIVGIVVLAAWQASVFFFFSMTGLEDRLNLERLRFKYRMNVSCNYTIVTPTCTTGTNLIDVYNLSGLVMVSSTGNTTDTGFNVQARCELPRNIVFEVKSKKRASDPWKSLFKIPLMCPRNF